ncbi:MAG: alanyl-tRNA editing protein [Acidobacteriota bacterium]
MRLYYDNAYAASFQARVTATAEEGRRVYLDQTAFYPTSGGQLHDLGTLNGIPVDDVIDEEDGRIAHLLRAPLAAVSVHGEIDWPRRFDFMQQHSGQHLLSSVIPQPTVSVHLGLETSTIDVAADQLDLPALEDRANAAVFANLPVRICYEDAATATGLRKATGRTGILRIITIEGLDRSACGGTHVRATGEIGPILLLKTEKMRGNLRLHFLCGQRALRGLRADQAQRQAALAQLTEEAREAGKRAAKLALDLAADRGRELYAQSPALRLAAPVDDHARALANAFLAAGPGTILFTSPQAVLFASNQRHCGNELKALLSAHGGRGGGSANLAQGSLPDAAAVEAVAVALGFPAVTAA